MLTISQAKYFNFAIDDVDQAQAHPQVMSEALAWAGYRMAETMDEYYAGFYSDATSSVGSSVSPVVISAPTAANAGAGTTAYDYLIVLAQKLTENLTPKIGRWCVVPPWFKTYLMQDTRFTSYNTQQARASIENGTLDGNSPSNDALLGKVEGMDVYESVNAPHIGGTLGIAGSQDVVLAGHTMAVTKAEGLSKVEAYRPPTRFSDAVKGLTLYGAKTVRPYALAVGYFQHP